MDLMDRDPTTPRSTQQWPKHLHALVPVLRPSPYTVEIADGRMGVRLKASRRKV